MDIAVTGASGFIGSELVRSLRDDGHQVLVVTRSETVPADCLGWDPAAGTIDAAGFEGLDAVVHLAGEPVAAKRWSDAQKDRIRSSRVSGTGLLASTLASLARPPGVLVSGSAIGIYGDRGDEVLTEVSDAARGFLADVVREWEAAATPALEAGIRVPFLRTGIVLDRRGGALAKMLTIFKLGLGGKMGKGDQWWSWISMADEVRAIRHCIDHDLAGPVNLTGPEPVTNKVFTKALGALLHRPTVLPIPRFAPGLLLGRELANELLFTSARVRPVALEQSGFRFDDADVTAALDSAINQRR